MTLTEHTTETTDLFDLEAADVAWRDGPDPLDAIVGRRAVFTTSDGARLVGTLERPLPTTGRYPIVRFPSGQWGRCDAVVELVVE